MRKILGIILFINFLKASLIPYTNSAQITEVKGSYVTLSNNIGINGVSGAVIRNMQNGNKIIVSYVKQISPNRAKIIDFMPLNAKSLAKFKDTAKVNDNVIGGLLYNKVMVLAKNKQDFLDIQSSFGIDSINPDTFITYLATKNKNSYDYSDLNKFGKLYGVGIFVIEKNGFLEVVDAISKEVVNRVKYSATKGEIKPFFNNLNN